MRRRRRPRLHRLDRPQHAGRAAAAARALPARGAHRRPEPGRARGAGGGVASRRSPAWLAGTDGAGPVVPRCLVEAATHPDVDIVVNAVVGAAGLDATLAALRAGKRVALANKETLVMAGELVAQAACAGGGEIVPIDSEHSAVLQCVTGRDGGTRPADPHLLGRPVPGMGRRSGFGGPRWRRRSSIRPGGWAARSRWTARRSPTRRLS